MTGAQQVDGSVPAGRGLGRLTKQAAPTEVRPQFTEAEVTQGQSDAMLGGLTRLQLRVEVLAREQSDMFAQILDLLVDLKRGEQTSGSSVSPR